MNERNMGAYEPAGGREQTGGPTGDEDRPAVGAKQSDDGRARPATFTMYFNTILGRRPPIIGQTTAGRAGWVADWG